MFRCRFFFTRILLPVANQKEDFEIGFTFYPEYHPEPYNPEAPLLRNNQNDFWHGGRGRGGNRGGRGRPHGDREHDMDPMDRGDRIRQPYQTQQQQTRRDLVSIPTIPEPQGKVLFSLQGV